MKSYVMPLVPLENVVSPKPDVFKSHRMLQRYLLEAIKPQRRSLTIYDLT
jgi:hypothetical protein